MSDPDIFFAKNYNNSEQSSNCMVTLYELYKKQRFIDATFMVGDQNFRVHKNILAASSGYFLEKFTDENEEYDFPELTNIDPLDMNNIIKYCYTGELTLNPDNVSNVLNLASILKMDYLVKDITENRNKFER